MFPKINYIGNKEKIVDWICENIPRDVQTVFDAFSGGVSVSYALKRKNYQVISNDILKVNSLLATALVENRDVNLGRADITKLLSGNPVKGFMYKKYSNVFYFPTECMELDLFRRNIEKFRCKYKKAMGFSLIRRAMIRKMPYSRFTIPWNKIIQLRNEDYSYKKYKRRRAYHNQTFKEHILENIDAYNSAVFDNKKKNRAYNRNIFDALKEVKADLIYIDPPYPGTMNDYHNFYSVMDNYINSKEVPRPRETFTDQKSALNLFGRLFSSLSNFKYFILSYNTASFPSINDMQSILSGCTKNLRIVQKQHNYQITGKEKKRITKEVIFVGQLS